MSLFQTYQAFKSQLANPTEFRTVQDFWEAWHKFTGDSKNHPYEAYEFAMEDNLIMNEKASVQRNERIYQHRLAGRPTRRF